MTKEEWFAHPLREEYQQLVYESVCHAVRIQTLEKVIKLCRNYEFNVQGLIRQIEDIK